MILLRFLFRYSRSMMIWTSLAALVSGACNAGLIALINRALTHNAGHPTTALLIVFVALGLGRIVTNAISQVSLAYFSQATTARLRQDLVEKILHVPLRHLEELGAARLLVTLTEDVAEITQATLTIPIFTVNAAVLLGGTVYLGWLSLPVLLAMGVFMVGGAISYRMLVRAGFGHLSSARNGQDALFRHFRALTEGVKELKLHRARRDAFLAEDIATATKVCQRHNVAAEIRFIIAQNWNQLLLLTLIGMILFLLPRMETITPATLTGYIIATLYLMGPLAGLLGCLSVFTRAKISLRKVEELGLALATHATDRQPTAEAPAEAEPFESLELTGVMHHYHREREDDHFMLGPIDLVFRPGELVFLVGGNGSGKSTLAKVVTGLYPPAAGEIRLNGRLIDDGNRDYYRQHFSAIFADFYLFDRIVGVVRPGADERARKYLARLHLDHKVTVSQGAFSTTQLSSGQRKRLALLCAYLEDRPFYLFDEWASDQDPLFKDVFYTQLLPELRAEGKAVLVITHDDKYFSIGDRLVKLDYGKITVIDGAAPGIAGPAAEPALSAV
jgi:putative pyoverdin transport system ATP-binding/permease protein